MSHEQKHEQPTSQNQQDTAPAATPVIAWEQPLESKSVSTSSNVIDIETYRRQEATTIDSEATVTVREFPAFHNEAPIRLIVVSSGFGQKHTVHANTLQCKAA